MAKPLDLGDFLSGRPADGSDLGRLLQIRNQGAGGRPTRARRGSKSNPQDPDLMRHPAKTVQPRRHIAVERSATPHYGHPAEWLVSYTANLVSILSAALA